MNKIIVPIAIGGVIIALIIGGILLVNTQEPSSNVATPGQTQSNASTSTVPANAYILDVRTPEEYATSHAKTADNLSLQDIEKGNMPNTPKDDAIYLYCRSGSRSAQATTLLKQAGFTNVIDLGGLEDAKAAGLEFTQ